MIGNKINSCFRRIYPLRNLPHANIYNSNNYKSNAINHIKELSLFLMSQIDFMFHKSLKLKLPEKLMFIQILKTLPDK